MMATEGWIHNPTLGKSVKKTIFIDTGSQKNYISSELVKHLELKSSIYEHHGVVGFGNVVS